MPRGGARPNSGPKPKWWKDEAQRLLKTTRGLKIMEKALNGEPVDVFITDQGEEIPIRPKFKDIKDTIFQLACHGYGNPSQGVEISGEATFNLPEAVAATRTKRGLPL